MAARKKSWKPSPRPSPVAREREWKPPISSEAVAAKTGRGWDEWLAIIDRENGRSIGHSAIADLLHSKYGVPGWWSQMVTVGYEQARGLRRLHQKPGGYEISSTRIIDARVGRVFDAWLDAKTRSRWLPRTPITIHKSTRDKSLRVTWIDGARSIGVNFIRKGAAKTQVALQHGKLGSAGAAKKMKAFWGARLDALKKLLT